MPRSLKICFTTWEKKQQQHIYVFLYTCIYIYIIYVVTYRYIIFLIGANLGETVIDVQFSEEGIWIWRNSSTVEDDMLMPKLW